MDSHMQKQVFFMTWLVWANACDFQPMKRPIELCCYKQITSPEVQLRPVRRRGGGGGAGDAFAPPFWSNYFKIMQFFAYPQWRIQRGFGGFKRTPYWAHIISFSWGISGKTDQTAQTEPPQLIWTPVPKILDPPLTPQFRPKMVIFLKIHTPFQKTACVPGYYDWILVSPGNRWLPVASAIKHISTQDCIACNYCNITACMCRWKSRFYADFYIS